MKKNNNKKGKDYFSQSIERYGGEDFLRFKNAAEIEREAPRIFRDLARGNVNIHKFGYMFLNNQFLSSLIKSANENYEFYNISYQGVNTLMYHIINNGMVIDNKITNTLNQHKVKCEAYSVILRYLNALQSSQDLNYLPLLVNALSQYKYII